MKIRTLIIDDMRLARERVRRFLRDDPEIEIVREVANVPDAIKGINDLSPDLIFLDIQMPEIDGFGLLGSLDKEKMPVIIFVTAFEEFAVKAFQVHAIDYLLTPFVNERFEFAVS